MSSENNAKRTFHSDYYTIFDSANDAIFVHDIDTGAILDINQKGLQMYGYSRDEITRVNVEALSSGEHPYTQDVAEQKIRLAAEGKPQIFEWRTKRKNGQLFWVEVNLKSVTISGKKRILAIVRDITERKKAERELRANERFMSDIFSSIQDGISVLDKNMNITRVNSKMQEWYSHNMPLVGKKCYAAYHGKDTPCTVCPTARALQEGKMALEVVPKTAAGGEIVGWFDLYSFPLVNSQTGEIDGVIEYVRDITERKGAEEKAARTLILTEATLESIDNGILVINDKREVIKANTVFAELWRIPEELMNSGKDEELLGYVLDQLTDPDQFITKVNELYDNPELESFDTFDFKDGRIFERFSRSMFLAGRALARVWSFRDVTERKKAESQMQLLSSMVQQSSEGMAITDLEGKILFLNNAFAQMHGYSPQELVGKDLSIFHTKEQMPVVEAANRELKRTGSFKGEIGHVRRDGTTFPGLVNNSFLRDNSGNVFAMVGMLRDITERKKAQEVIKLEKEKMQHYLNVSSVMFVAIDRKGNVVLINKKGCEILGYKEKEIVGKNWFDNFLPKRIRADVKKVFEKVILGEQAKMIEYSENPVLTKTGQERIIAWHNSILKDSDDKVIGSLSSGADITERVKSIEALHRTEARVRSIFRAAPIGIGLLVNRMLLEVNDKVCEMVGRTREELLGKSTRILYPTQEDYEYVGKEKYGQIKKRGSGTVQTRWQHKSGNVIDILLSSTLINPGDLSSGATFTALDITESKRANNALKQSEALLKKQKIALEDKTTALSQIIEQVEIEKSKIKADALANVEELLVPILDKIRLKGESRKYIDLLRRGLADLTSTFGQRIARKTLKLSPREIETCNMIKEGMTSKDIAKLLNISEQTIEKHRKDIRRKLGLTNKDINLTTYLQKV